MTRTFLFLLATLFIKTANCQTQVIPNQKIDDLGLSELFCIDSFGNATKLCPVDLEFFHVKFSKASFDKRTHKLRLVGRVSPPMLEVGIYLSEVNVIKLKDTIAYTTYNSKDLDKNGYFDISFIVKPKQSLFFYHPAFFAKKFDLYKLL